METILSDSELVDCLENIRAELQNIDFLYNGQVVFLNLVSFYNYINDVMYMTNGAESPLKEMIELIRPYIPMTISEEHMEMFLNAAINGNEEALHNIENYFDKIAKINFINSIFQATNQESWEQIIQICRTMRRIKEEQNNVFSYQF